VLFSDEANPKIDVEISKKGLSRFNTEPKLLNPVSFHSEQQQQIGQGRLLITWYEWIKCHRDV
jgi:hypothetical protein